MSVASFCWPRRLSSMSVCERERVHLYIYDLAHPFFFFLFQRAGLSSGTARTPVAHGATYIYSSLQIYILCVWLCLCVYMWMCVCVCLSVCVCVCVCVFTWRADMEGRAFLILNTHP